VKTKLAKAIAGEAHAAFLPISPSDVLSKFIGESESAIREIFVKAAKQATRMESKCAVIFFDEIDALGQSRESRESSAGDGCSRRVLAELLVQLNHVASCRGSMLFKPHAPSCAHDINECERNVGQASFEHVRVLVVGATNRIFDCDDALKRRFGVQLEVGLPSFRDRKNMIIRNLREIETALTVEEIEYISIRTESWTGSDIENLVRDAAMTPVRECIKKVAEQRKREEITKQRVSNNHKQRDNILCDAESVSSPSSALVQEITTMRPVALSDFAKSFSLFTGQDFFMFSSLCRRPYNQHESNKEDNVSSEDEE
jgi:SpoVK/Ycf46/Vps4 family AAA+-type ATPase